MSDSEAIARLWDCFAAREQGHKYFVYLFTEIHRYEEQLMPHASCPMPNSQFLLLLSKEKHTEKLFLYVFQITC